MFSFFKRGPSVKDRVAKGVYVLAAYDPDWFDHVDLYRLDMTSIERCVVSQVTGSMYGTGLMKLGVKHGLGEPYGFNVDQLLSSQRQWDKLQAEWTRVVIEKRDQRTVTLIQSDTHVTQ